MPRRGAAGTHELTRRGDAGGLRPLEIADRFGA